MMTDPSNSKEKKSSLEENQSMFQHGLELYNKGQFREALPYFQALDHPSFEILKQYHLGLVFVNLGDFEKGIAHYRQIREIPTEICGIEYDNFMYGLYINMGSALQVLAKHKHKRLYEEALECYRYALQIEDTDPRVWNNLGNVYLEIQQYQAAIDAFQKAIGLDDEYPEAHYSLSLVYESMSNYPEAIHHLKEALRWKANNKTILNRIAALSFGTGNFEEAQQYIAKVLSLDQTNLPALKNMVLILYNQHEYNAAYEYYTKILKLFPEFHEKEIQSILEDLLDHITHS